MGKSQKCGIGMGKKVDIAKKSESPSPNKYNAISDFDLTKKNVSMGKFALGRDVKMSFYVRKSRTMGFSSRMTTLLQEIMMSEAA